MNLNYNFLIKTPDYITPDDLNTILEDYATKEYVDDEIDRIRSPGKFYFGDDGEWWYVPLIREDLSLRLELWNEPGLAPNAKKSFVDLAGQEREIDTNHFNVSGIISMWGMFSSKTDFNQDISGWDVSNVTNMENMFSYAAAFNQDIGGWDTSNVTSMRNMFTGASAFNQDIGGWSTVNVIDMENMFSNASAFEQDLSGWCVSNIPSRPTNFSDGSQIIAEPVWGTCPGNP